MSQHDEEGGDVRATRRSLLAVGGAGALALAAVSARAAPKLLDLATAAGRLRAFMQMRGALDGRLVMGFISGRYYGVVDDEIRPLYGVVGATFARYRARADGGYDGASYEVPFFTDLDSGAVLDRWRNPYTGEVVTAPQTALPPAGLVIQPDLQIVLAKSPPGLVSANRVISTLQSDPDVWMTEQTTGAFTPPGAPRPIRYSEVVTLHALRPDFRSPDVGRVPCQTSYTSVVSWRPWLNMGARPGHLMGTGTGRYGVALNSLPETWSRGAASRRPDVLKNPGLPLAGLLQD